MDFQQNLLALLSFLVAAIICRGSISRKTPNEMDHIFICGDGAHIPIDWVCDGQIDCLTDKTDEEDCGGGITPFPLPPNDSLPLLRPGPSQFGKKRKGKGESGGSQNLSKLPKLISSLKSSLPDISKTLKNNAPPVDVVQRRKASDPVIPKQEVSEGSLCPPSDILHQICSKTLSTALKELVIDSLHEQEARKKSDEPIGPLSVNQVLRSCLSYATYNGCLIALAPNKECVPHRTISLLLNTTYHLFCNTEILGNMSLHASCLSRVKETPEVQQCRERHLGRAVLPSAKFEVCEMVTNFYEFSQCIQGSVEKLCDLGAVNFLEDIQQAFVHELLKNHCEEISQLRLFQIQAEEAKKEAKDLTTIIAGTNLPPNQWLMEMANRDSGLMGDTCTALRIYERCLEETVFRRDGRCAFRSWVPIHVEIAQNVLCDNEVLELLPQFQDCLLEANATLDMDLCADMDIEIVRLIRSIYDTPGDDTTCPVLSRLRESYECISDVAFETCGRDILYVIGKVRMNVVRIAIEEGCSVCS